ncbi:zip homologous protein 2-like [Vespa crabro]|uniref:zip homologous protein 2-like n=1 Tax=Vespa crabro TaxID=7445 RepID=UPI001F020194|nr:zip homologous protein 2-like [Vespa crabro]
MDQYICNKCYCTQSDKDLNFRLTQCGHIFCYNCIREDECPECKSTKIVTVSLTKPLTPEVSRFFAPLNDILTSVKSITIFQSEQINIILQCFYQLNDKYEILKDRYINAVRNEKLIAHEYYNLKKHFESLNKQLMFVKMHRTDSKVITATSSLTNNKYITGRYSKNKIYDTPMTKSSCSKINNPFKRNIFTLQKSINNSSISISDKSSL